MATRADSMGSFPKKYYMALLKSLKNKWCQQTTASFEDTPRPYVLKQGQLSYRTSKTGLSPSFREQLSITRTAVKISQL